MQVYSRRGRRTTEKYSRWGRG